MDLMRQSGMSDDIAELWIVDNNPLRRAAFHAVFASVAVSEKVIIKSLTFASMDNWNETAAARALSLVVLGGHALSGEVGRKLLHPIIQNAGSAPIAVVLDNVTGSDIDLALDMRLRGIICTQDEPGVALAAIKFLLAGGKYVPHDRAHDRDTQITLPPEPAMPNAPPVDHAASAVTSGSGLTPRQGEVFSALARGASNKSIARSLNLSEATVKIHVRNILQKLSVKNRVEAALHARNALQSERAPIVKLQYWNARKI